MEQHHEQFENEPDQTTDRNADTSAEVEKTETHDIADLVAGWEEEWKKIFQKRYTDRPMLFKSGAVIGAILARDINFKPNYRTDIRTEQLIGKTYPANVITSKYPYSIEHDFCLHLIEEAKLVLPSNDEQVRNFNDSIDSSIESAISVIMRNGSDTSIDEHRDIWILMQKALHEILDEYFASEINELNAYSRLVRPAEAPADQALLRPAGLGETSNTAELLRPSRGQTREYKY